MIWIGLGIYFFIGLITWIVFAQMGSLGGLFGAILFYSWPLGLLSVFLRLCHLERAADYVLIFAAIPLSGILRLLALLDRIDR